MTEQPKRQRMSIDEFTALSPNERYRIVQDGIITDWEQVPEHFRERVLATARQLVEDGYGR